MNNVYFIVAVVVVLLFLVAYFARQKGTVKKKNVLVQLADNVLVKVRSFFSGVVEDTRDHVAAAEIDIQNANRQLDKFEEEILNLREELRVQKKDLTVAKSDVKKWESIYQQTVKAGDEKGQAESSRKLKSADSRLNALNKLVEENERVVYQLEEQKKLLRDSLSNAEVLKDRLAAQKTSAELRQKAHSYGNSAASGLAVLKDLEEEVNRAEARAEAIEEVKAEETALEDKYSSVNEEFDRRLEELRKNA